MSIWETIHWARTMACAARDLDVPHAITDLEGRPVIDCLPAVDVYEDEEEPITVRNPAQQVAA